MRSMRQKRARIEGNEGETSSDELVPSLKVTWPSPKMLVVESLLGLCSGEAIQSVHCQGREQL